MVRTSPTSLKDVSNMEFQVLNKRKPVHLIPSAPNISDNAEVFVMKGTDEVFLDYEKYLKRYDWLSQVRLQKWKDAKEARASNNPPQKKFTDAVNGKSGLTYWDALESETKSSATIEIMFPEVLRDPILRRVQFSTTSRMDELVNNIYDEFKHDFFPGEDVIVTFDEGDQWDGSIREKAKFPMIRGADGSVQRPAFSRYFVRINTPVPDEALVDERHIRRDRKVFTKQNLRAFLKNSLQREAWNGAPWLVKEHLAIQYRLPMEIPAHLLQDARLMASKQQILQTQKHKTKRPKNMDPQEFARLQQEEMRMSGQGQQNGAQHHAPNQNQTIAAQAKPAAPVIKYPIEDLDIAPKRNGVTRPELKFFTDEMADYIKSNRRTTFDDITMDSMGMLLEVWNTLNVQCEVYVLDSFTFDDFVDAMHYSSIDLPCELFEEIHCAVLKLFVDAQGILLVKGFPKKVEESEGESEAPDESELSTPMPDVPARSTRSRLSYVESAGDLPSPDPKAHRAADLLGDRGWMERIVAQDFPDGGWQVIVVGILHQLSTSPLYQSRCEEILAQLVPEDINPTKRTVIAQYANLDINLRISALQMLTLFTITTDKIKDFLDTCSDDMTEVRKRKIEHQREKRTAMDELALKDRERKILLPENLPESPKVIIEVDNTEDTINTNGADSSEMDDDDEVPSRGRGLRRAGDRKRKRDEDAARREKERIEKAEAAKAQSKHSREFRKVLHDIEELKKKMAATEEKITECDTDLREANVQRTKVLGKDRFCNRYYWFERNGQPFGGLPTSSTASYGYANGRLWVQGPDEMERDGYIDRTKEEQAEYQQKFRMSVPERRQLEEGATTLVNAREWGFYDDPDRVDNLIGWLDERGDREKKLRKELCEWRDKIVEFMEAHKKFKDDEVLKKLEADEEQSSRITTRHKTQEDRTASQDRCLKWTNTMAMEELDHLHSQPVKPKAKRGKRESGKGVAQVIASRSKPLTRQGDKSRS